MFYSFIYLYILILSCRTPTDSNWAQRFT